MLRSLQLPVQQSSPLVRFLSPTRYSRSFTTKTGQVDLVASDTQRRTIYALSTPPGKGGVAVIRISGPDVLLVWNSMVRTLKQKAPEPWKMERCHIVHPLNKSKPLDDGLAVYFKGPRSFTTEDIVELHLHSGRAIISSVLGALSQLPFCRPAEAGEFTRRAFLGGRLDLTQVEGLKDLINAETETQRRIAMVAAGGTVRAQYDDLRSGIIGCLANVEALIDFGEGEDIEEGVYDEARSRAQNLLARIQNHLQDHRRGEIIRSGVRLAIFGPPNAGKSSLLNFLGQSQREAAIVTSVPGTTRDILELSLDIGGLPVIVSDTAGVRATDDLVESIGIDRARKAVQAADLSLCVLSLPDVLLHTPKGLCLHIPPALENLIKPDTLILFNKSDMASAEACKQALTLSGHTAWAVSLTTGQATPEFLTGFAEALQHRFNLNETELSGETPLITRERHRVHLESACRFLQAFLDTTPSDIVLAAEELRYAAQ
ncbi:tRNA modification GTPase GTPBP3, mitochondrial [Termitomyces sp. J132]|nr:tRNA modification GTPase GTPBP3, mitochondrial [Termitomyces sp. J132]